MKYDLSKLSKMDKYKENLLVSDLTKVAEIDHINRIVKPLGWWSATTSKHINYVAKSYNYKVEAK